MVEQSWSANIVHPVTPSDAPRDLLDLSDLNAVANEFLKKFTRDNDSEGDKQLRHQKSLLGLWDYLRIYATDGYAVGAFS